MLGDLNAMVRKGILSGIHVVTCDLHDESNHNGNVTTSHAKPLSIICMFLGSL
jgi:hypothetical protein